MTPFIMRAKRGFTLIEILVAVAIFAIIAVASSTVLSNVIASADDSASSLAQLEKLQRAMLIIEQDVTQAIPLAPRVQGQQNDVVLQGGKGVADSLADGVLFSRNGWANPQQRLPRATVQSVGYRLNSDNQLERLYTQFIDNLTNTEPKVRVLLDNIEDLTIEYTLGTDGQNDIRWESAYRGTVLPKGIAITLTSTEFGVIRREFALLSPPAPTLSTGTPSAQPNSSLTERGNE
jgi:general secretion pathway protein J